MKQVVLDTNFIISCAKNKIDFFEEILLMGMQIIIPMQVIRELERLNFSDSKLALKILEKNKFKKINLGFGHVDKKIISHARKNPEMVIATLDREMKKKLKNNKLIIRGRKKLEIQ